MRILAIESSAKAASCAVWNDGALEAMSFQNVGLTHSRTLMPMIEDMMKNAALSMSDCGAVAVAHGPGSFTGVRIGVAAAKGLALGAGIPLYGVSTLEAMAHQSAVRDGMVLCAMDARRGEVYAALFDAQAGALTRLGDDFAAPAGEAASVAADACEKGKKMIFCVGDGAELCYNAVKGKNSALPVFYAVPHVLRQNAAGVAIAAERRIADGTADTDGSFGDAAALAPVYLRVPQAERERSAKLGI